jgi:N-acyl-D-aspartate/D-glutamate deacylase
MAGLWAWKSVKEHLDAMEYLSVPTNVGFLVPQANLRVIAVGNNPDGATPEQIEEMKEFLLQG